MGHKKGGCWLQVAGGCSLQVQINVKCLGGSPVWLLLAGGCSSQVVARAGWTVVCSCTSCRRHYRIIFLRKKDPRERRCYLIGAIHFY